MPHPSLVFLQLHFIRCYLEEAGGKAAPPSLEEQERLEAKMLLEISRSVVGVEEGGGQNCRRSSRRAFPWIELGAVSYKGEGRRHKRLRPAPHFPGKCYLEKGCLWGA